MNLKAQFIEAATTADFTLLISVEDPEGANIATVTSISVDDPNLNTRLRDICQAFRMGAIHGYTGVR